MSTTSADDRLTRTISVPAWMVWLFTSLMTVLAGGAVATVSMTVNHVFQLSQNQAEIKQDIAALKVKEQDLVSAYNGVNRTLSEMAADIKSIQRELEKRTPQ